jgi:hypothetical protein
MQNFQLAVKQRILAEYTDFELDYPEWLRTILTDDLRYVITLVTVCANSFALGILIGWLVTI